MTAPQTCSWFFKSNSFSLHFTNFTVLCKDAMYGIIGESLPPAIRSPLNKKKKQWKKITPLIWKKIEKIKRDTHLCAHTVQKTH